MIYYRFLFRKKIDEKITVLNNLFVLWHNGRELEEGKSESSYQLVPWLETWNAVELQLKIHL